MIKYYCDACKKEIYLMDLMTVTGDLPEDLEDTRFLGTRTLYFCSIECLAKLPEAMGYE